MRALIEQHSERQRKRLDMNVEDCALSAWASGLSISEAKARLEIIENEGLAEFPALFHLDGRRARAKAVSTRYGMKWMVADENGNAVEWLPYKPKRASTLEKRGYREGTEMVPAWASLSGGGTGLSGCCSTHVVVYRLDCGWPEGAC